MKTTGLKKRMAVLGATMALITAMAMPAFAGETYTPVAGTSTTFTKYLVVPDGTKVPNVTFSYTIAPGAPISTPTDDNETFQVLAGVDADKITISDTTFNANDTLTAAAVDANIDVKRADSARVDGGSAATGVEFETTKGEKFAMKTATVDFSQVHFDEPGVYRYIISETPSAENAAKGIIHDTDTDRVLDVYVTHSDAVGGTAATPDKWEFRGNMYDSESEANFDRNFEVESMAEEARAEAEATGEPYDYVYERLVSQIPPVTFIQGTPGTPGTPGLAVSGYVLHTSVDDATPAIGADMGTADVAADGTALPDKTDGFTNEYKPKDLVFKKQVTGNQASRDKYFDFTLTMENVNDNDKFIVSLADDNDANTTDGNADATSGTNSATIAANTGKTNPTEVTGAQLKAGTHFYIQHNQSIAVRGLPLDASYEVTENAEDYKSTPKAVEEHTDNTSGVIGTVAGTNQAVKTSYLNTRNGVIPTGVLMTVAPFIGIAAIGGAGFAFASRKKKDDDED